MATYQGQTVDIYEDFEDALSGDWSETDSAGNLNPQDANAKYDGLYGVSVDWTDSTVAYLTYTFSTDRADLSLGFWYKTASDISNYAGTNIVLRLQGAGAQNILRVYDGRNAGDNTREIVLRGTVGFGSSIAVADNTWYWVTLDCVKNGTSELRLYNTSETLVGTSTSTAADYDVHVIHVGHQYGSVTGSDSTYIDDFVIDYTNQTFPLLGWSTAGGGVTIPIMMHHYAMMGR